MRAVARQRFDSGDEAALGGGDGDRAAPHRLAVDVNGAGPAIAGAAAIFGAGEIGSVAQRPEEGGVGVHQVVDGLAVDGEAGHGATLSGGAGREKTPRRSEEGRVGKEGVRSGKSRW